ncbi:RNA polymerase sigma factor [Fluviicola sp.]|jgi:RNA polymerase sigma-70 factor (ECF subfamily)|uniref:RNA polymerase sigma factor n=1 Tax=Fluviicola sp. TaxID=1917219 RepID=UPI002836E146|nr:RNA polymerase sigma factor [Fluviicola sp.]MDR0802655.1 RNA polymerase sigma factor [Fluviicola sp.]
MTRKEYNKAVELYADNLFRFVVKHTQNKMLSEDIVQDTFSKVWEKHESIEALKAKSYLFTTAYHQLVDTLKKEKRSGSFDGQNVKQDDPLSHLFDVQKTLQEAVNKLPEIQKTVILLRDYEGYNYNEIAEITSLNESQVKVYIFRARQTLKNYLKSTELVA